MSKDSALDERIRNIRLLVLDVDGILTDGRLYFGPKGTELKVFHTLDGRESKHCAAAEWKLQSSLDAAVNRQRRVPTHWALRT